MSDFESFEDEHVFKFQPGEVYEDLLAAIAEVKDCQCDEAYTEACRLAAELYGFAAVGRGAE